MSLRLFTADRRRSAVDRKAPARALSPKQEPTITSKLPAAVPPTNSETGANRLASRDPSSNWAAPDASTPQFAAKKPRTHRAVAPTVARHAMHEDYDEYVDGDDRLTVSNQARRYALIVTGVVLGLLFLVVLATIFTGSPVPSCDSQPDWNQYNCQR